MKGENMDKNILTPREIEVLNLLIYGYNNSKISEKLCISTRQYYFDANGKVYKFIGKLGDRT